MKPVLVKSVPKVHLVFKDMMVMMDNPVLLDVPVHQVEMVKTANKVPQVVQALLVKLLN